MDELTPQHDQAITELQAVLASRPMRNILEALPNIWDIENYGHSSYETRYSRFLRWLLDPNENHRLGPLFVNDLIDLCNSKLPQGQQVPHVDSEDEIVVSSHRSNPLVPNDNESDDIDVLVVDKTKRFYIIIENKLGDELSEHQLPKYRESLAENLPDYQALRVYLAPEGRAIPNYAAAEVSSYWIPITYRDLFPILDQEIDTLRYQSHAMKLIEDFLFDAKRRWSKELDDVIKGTWNSGEVLPEYVIAVLQDDVPDGLRVSPEDYLRLRAKLEDYLPKTVDTRSHPRTQEVAQHVFTQLTGTTPPPLKTTLNVNPAAFPGLAPFNGSWTVQLTGGGAHGGQSIRIENNNGGRVDINGSGDGYFPKRIWSPAEGTRTSGSAFVTSLGQGNDANILLDNESKMNDLLQALDNWLPIVL